MQFFEIMGCYYNKSLPYVTVDSHEGATVHLHCSFCGAVREVHVTYWFYRKRGNLLLKPWSAQANINNSKNKILESGVLVINSFNLNDSGVYVCKQDENNNFTFTYVLDGIFKIDVRPLTGTFNQYWKLIGKQISTLDRKFTYSQDEPFASLRKNEVTFNMNITWGLWGPCEIFKSNETIRKRLGRCRLIPIPTRQKTKETEIVKYYIKDGFDLSCRSIKLNETFPRISKIVRNLPDYEETEACVAVTDSTDNLMVRDEYHDQSGKISMQIAENSHCTLICSEGIIIGSKVVWYKDKEILNSSYRNNISDKKAEPHLFIDEYNMLYILHATKKEEGSYVCTINDIKSREYFVTVVSMAKILNQDFIRYSIYLGFVLSLTVTCYCAGLCVAWHRRASFADPLNLDYKNVKKKYGLTKNEESETLINKE